MLFLGFALFSQEAKGKLLLDSASVLKRVKAGGGIFQFAVLRERLWSRVAYRKCTEKQSVEMDAGISEFR